MLCVATGLIRKSAIASSIARAMSGEAADRAKALLGRAAETQKAEMQAALATTRVAAKGPRSGFDDIGAIKALRRALDARNSLSDT